MYRILIGILLMTIVSVSARSFSREKRSLSKTVYDDLKRRYQSQQDGFHPDNCITKYSYQGGKYGLDFEDFADEMLPPDETDRSQVCWDQFLALYDNMEMVANLDSGESPHIKASGNSKLPG